MILPTTLPQRLRQSAGVLTGVIFAFIPLGANAGDGQPTPVPGGRVKSILADEIKFHPITEIQTDVPAAGIPVSSRPTPAPRPRLSPDRDIVVREARTKRVEPKATEAEEVPPDVVLLDKMEVTAHRDPFVQNRLAELEERKEREMRRTEISSLDEVLNHPKLSFLGPFSSVNRVNQAKGAINMMEFERSILMAIQFAETEAERDRLKRLLLEIRYGLRQR